MMLNVLYYDTVNSQTISQDFRRFDSSGFSMLRGGIPGSSGNFLQILTWRLSVCGFSACGHRPDVAQHVYVGVARRGGGRLPRISDLAGSGRQRAHARGRSELAKRCESPFRSRNNNSATVLQALSVTDLPAGSKGPVNYSLASERSPGSLIDWFGSFAATNQSLLTAILDKTGEPVLMS